MRVGQAAALALLLGCSALPPAPPPPLPVAMAELHLSDSAAALARIARDDDPGGALARRRAVIADVERQLLSATPPDVYVPELFDVLVAMAPRMEAGAIDAAWASYVFTSYERGLRHDRPTGDPRRTPAEVESAVAEYVEFFELQARDSQRRDKKMEDAAFEEMRAWRAGGNHW